MIPKKKKTSNILRKSIIKKMDIIIDKLESDKKENDLKLPVQGQNPNC